MTINADVDSGSADSYLSPKVRLLCALIENWKIDPEHDTSQSAAWLVRNLAIHMFNKHDKLDFARQLTAALLGVFEGAGEVSGHIAGDAKALQKIAVDRTAVVERFREFDLNGDSFSYKGSVYRIGDIRHIGFYRAVTTHKTNFIETGRTGEAHIFLTIPDIL